MRALVSGLMLGLGVAVAGVVAGLTGIALYYLGVGVMFVLVVISDRRS